MDLGALDPFRLSSDNVMSLVAMLGQARSQGQLEEPGAALADWLLRVGETDTFEACLLHILLHGVAFATIYPAFHTCCPGHGRPRRGSGGGCAGCPTSRA